MTPENVGPFQPPTPTLVQQRSLVSPTWEDMAGPPLCLNVIDVLKSKMSDEKRKGDVVGPYAMNFAPFLEDIALRETSRPSSVMAEGGKSLPYDPPKFHAVLSKGEREKNRLGVLEKREKDRIARERAMIAKADRIEASRRFKGSQPEKVALGGSPPGLESQALTPSAPLAAVDSTLARFESEEEGEDSPQVQPLVENNLSVLDELSMSELGTPALGVPTQSSSVASRLVPQVLESQALAPTASFSAIVTDLAWFESEEEDEDPPQVHPLIENNLSVLDELSMPELGTPALVVPTPAQHSPVSSSDISAEDVLEVPRFRARSRVQPLDSQMDFFSNEVGTVLGMHLLPSGKYLAVTRASVRMFCRISEEYKAAFEASRRDMKTLQRKLKSWGVEFENKIEWRHVPIPNVTLDGAQAEVVWQDRSDAELYLQEYLRRVEGFGKADIEVFLQYDLNFRANFLAWLPVGPLIPRNILRRLEIICSPKYTPKAVASELRELWAWGQEVNRTTVDRTCDELPRFKELWQGFVTSSGGVPQATETFRSSIRACLRNNDLEYYTQ